MIVDLTEVPCSLPFPGFFGNETMETATMATNKNYIAHTLADYASMVFVHLVLHILVKLIHVVVLLIRHACIYMMTFI